MKAIIAKDQVELGAARCIQLAVSGIQFRLFRSLITVAILGLAVAFLAHMLAYSILSGGSERAIWEALQEEREQSAQLRRLEQADAIPTVIRQLSLAAPGRMDEYRVWGALSAEELAEASRLAGQFEHLEQDLEAISDRNRAILLGDRTVFQLLAHFQRDDARQTFYQRAEQLDIELPLEDRPSLDAFISTSWPRLREVVAKIRRGQNAAADELMAEQPQNSLVEALQADPSALEKTAQSLGFDVRAYDYPQLAAFAEDAFILRALEESVTTAEIRLRLAGELARPPQEVTATLLYQWIVEDPRNAARFDQIYSEVLETDPLGTENTTRAAEDFLRLQALQNLVPQAPDMAAASGFFGLDRTARWLIALAFTVCVIGVANALLMSVTERFTEIATMKCLGAMDKFVMLMFVFESAIQGIVGGIFGALLGVALALLRGGFEYGEFLVFTDVAFKVVAAAGLSLLVGVGLAMLAAVGPSLIAARLAPMEAMRVE